MVMVAEPGPKLEQHLDISFPAEKIGVRGLVHGPHRKVYFMRQVHCDGCGFAESTDLPASKQKIQDVSLNVVNDKRFPEGTSTHIADLCPGCISMMLASYFNVPVEDRLNLAMPTWIEPSETEMEVV